MKQRVTYLDFLRCIAILFVITLHAITPILPNTALYQAPSWVFCILLNSISRMGVPLFFMISGYLMLSRPSTQQIGSFYRKNLPKLLVPLVIWNLIYYIFNVFQQGEAIRPGEFLQKLVIQGTSYHMWFVYTLLGIYLICPFLSRMTASCTSRELLLLIGIVLFPTTIRPLLNTIQPVYIFLFDPLLEGYLGYFLLGYWLGNADLSRRVRYLIYAGGCAGIAYGVWGNLSTATPEQIPLPFNGGYGINHYLAAAALFVLAQAFFRAREGKIPRVSAWLARLSDLVFGIYWIHVLVMDAITSLMGNDLSVIQYVGVRTLMTTLLSLVLVACISRLPGMKRILF